MPDIRYVCLSDIHFGADNSLLTHLPAAGGKVDATLAAPVLTRLVAGLRALISRNEDNSTRPTLILNGDIFELALANTNTAIMAFERFLELAMPAGGEPLFDDRVYVNPGNHDHHLWAVARETQYMNFIERCPPGTKLDVPWHTTKIFFDGDDPAPESSFLNSVAKRFPHLENIDFRVAYPNFGLRSADQSRAVVFHHGHFVEPIYRLMSRLRTIVFPNRQLPTDIWDVEAENSAWIEFFWSTMGTSDNLAEDVGAIYTKLQNEEQTEKMLERLAAGLIAWKVGRERPSFVDRVAGNVVQEAIDLFWDMPARLEVNDASGVLSDELETGLRAYAEGPLLKHIRSEWADGPADRTTFVFGHTHKPFAKHKANWQGYPRPVDVYNSGGWVVDTPRPNKLHGGAAILIDEELEVVSLRLYNEAARAGDYEVRVETAASVETKFSERVGRLVEQTAAVWRRFSETVAPEIEVRARHQKIKIDRTT